MFTKRTDKSVRVEDDRKATVPQSVAKPKGAGGKGVASILGPDLSVDGVIHGDDDLILDGRVKGEVSVRRLTLGRNGVVEGRVKAENVEIHGRIFGDIDAHTVKLFSTARVSGDITHADLSIEIGAHFEGRAVLREAETEHANVIEFDAARLKDDVE